MGVATIIRDECIRSERPRPPPRDPGGPMVYNGLQGALLALHLDPQLASGGPGWGLGLDWGPLVLRKSSVGHRRLLMHTKKTRYGDSALAGKRASGAPLSPAGALVLIASSGYVPG